MLGIVDELISGLTTMGEGSTTKDAEKPKKKVEAYVTMPDTYEGIYDMWAFLETEKGHKIDSELDPLVYSSGSQIPLLSAILKAKVTTEGIIFLPYYRAKYMNPKSKKVTKYEILYVPKFRQAEKTEEGEVKKVPVGMPRIITKKDFTGQPYRLIR